MARKKINVSKGTLFLALMVVSAGVFLLPQRVTQRLNFLFIRTFSSVLNIGRSGKTDPLKYNKMWTDYYNLQADYKTLHKRYEKLAQIRSGLVKPGPALVLATVINATITEFGHELFINKGESDGLNIGQYVLGQDSIIGTVTQTSKTTARIRLITDARHNIEVRIWRQGKDRYIPGRMTGDGKGLCRIPLVSADYDVKVADIVYAAARVGFLETPRVIGRVSEVKHDQDKPLLWDITVMPVHDMAKTAEVAVIVMETE
jgi:cell shape-determining protein MreC